MATGALIAVVLLVLVPVFQAVTMVQEVGLGETAVLHCPSNDDNHRFQFWQLQPHNLMIGPTNSFNRDKYKYEVLTGTLYIRGVSSREQGVYTCICKHITNNSFYAENIELIVKRDWEELYETDHFHEAASTKHLLSENAKVDECEDLLATACKRLETPLDHYKNIAIAWAVKFKKMDSQQQLFAKKAINDILLEGLMGTLTRDSVSINAYNINHVPISFTGSTSRPIYYNDQQHGVKITESIHLSPVEQPLLYPAMQYYADSKSAQKSNNATYDIPFQP